jgi:hypothetical protein
LAMNCGPLSEMTRGRASGYFSLVQREMETWRRPLASIPPFSAA